MRTRRKGQQLVTKSWHASKASNNRSHLQPIWGRSSSAVCMSGYKGWRVGGGCKCFTLRIPYPPPMATTRLADWVGGSFHYCCVAAWKYRHSQSIIPSENWSLRASQPATSGNSSRTIVYQNRSVSILLPTWQDIKEQLAEKHHIAFYIH